MFSSLKTLFFTLFIKLVLLYFQRWQPFFHRPDFFFFFCLIHRLLVVCIAGAPAADGLGTGPPERGQGRKGGRNGRQGDRQLPLQSTRRPEALVLRPFWPRRRLFRRRRRVRQQSGRRGGRGGGERLRAHAGRLREEREEVAESENACQCKGESERGKDMQIFIKISRSRRRTRRTTRTRWIAVLTTLTFFKI